MSGFVRRMIDVVTGRSSRPVPNDAEPVASVRSVAPPSTAATVVAAAAQEPRAPATVAAATAFAASVRHLPLFSGTATQLMRSVGDEDVAGHELARLIATDAGLVAHLLRIVNSPFYGYAHRIATVPDTLTVMGVNAVRRIVTASVLQRPLMSYLHDTNIVRAFWRHELTCAALAQHLAQRQGLDGEMAYMAGLMHDVGRLAMLIQSPQHADVLLPAARAVDGGALARETACFGFDHAQAGGALLGLWGLPAPIVGAALAHEDADVPQDRLAACVWRANHAAHDMEGGPDDDGDAEMPWMARIGLDPAQRRRILEEIRAFEAG